MQAIITRGKGAKSKEFRAVLKSKGRILAHTEHYKRMSALITMLWRNFKQFTPVPPEGWKK